MGLDEREYMNRNHDRVHVRKKKPHHHVKRRPFKKNQPQKHGRRHSPIMVPMPNPTYNQMRSFVSDDRTITHKYIPNRYVCHNFATDVIRNANKHNMRAGYVRLNMDDWDGSPGGHAIVAFKTSNKGLYFLEPQLDVIFSEKEMRKMIKNMLYTAGAFKYRNYRLRSYQIDWRGRNVLKANMRGKDVVHVDEKLDIIASLQEIATQMTDRITRIVSESLKRCTHRYRHGIFWIRCGIW